MTNFLMGKGFWDYVEGDNEDPLTFPKKNATIIKIRTWND